jgi:ribosome-associated toxin RatA of RatAB toxin-antitoxin module
MLKSIQQMSYLATIPVEFSYPRHIVYEALCDLGRYPLWNSGMTSISHTGRMHTGLHYETSTTILGRVNQAAVEVVEMIPDQLIVLASRTGLITFRAAFELHDTAPGACSVICNLEFKFSNAIFNLARPVVEAVTEARIRGDLEALQAILP